MDIGGTLALLGFPLLQFYNDSCYFCFNGFPWLLAVACFKPLPIIPFIFESYLMNNFEVWFSAALSPLLIFLTFLFYSFRYYVLSKKFCTIEIPQSVLLQFVFFEALGI